MSFYGLLKDTCDLHKRYSCQKMTYSLSAGTPVVGQTVTGATSHRTAVITRLFTGYLVVRTLSGTFTNGETIAIGGTFSATLGTVTEYRNASGELEYYWMSDQTSVPCRLYISGHSNVLSMTEKGVAVMKPLQVMLPSTTTITDTVYRLVTTSTNYAGTYDMTFVPRPNYSVLHHHEAVLQKVNNP